MSPRFILSKMVTRVKRQRETRRGLIRATTTTRATGRLKWFLGNATNRATRKECTIWKCKHGLNNQKAKAKDNFVAMINDQINIVQSDNDWWVDSGASKHVCKDRSFFKTLVSVEDGKVLYMGNTSTVDVKGIGQVELVFTFGKILNLNDVYFVPEVRKFLVFF